VVDKLLKRANPNIADNWGQLPVHLGAEQGHYEVVLALERSKLRMKCTDNQTAIPCGLGRRSLER
jgi:hypothetical protein